MKIGAIRFKGWSVQNEDERTVHCRFDPSEASSSGTEGSIVRKLESIPKKSRDLRVAVIGTYNTNLVIWCDEIPAKGQSILGGDFEFYCGGKGANCAVAAARAGCRVKFVGAHGPDTFGKMARDRLTKEGIDITDFIELPLSKTGVAMFFQEAKTGAHAALASISANNQFPPALVRKVEPFIRECDLVFTQFEISSSVLLEIYRVCHHHKKRLIVYAVPVQPQITLPKSSYLIVANDFEAPLLTGHADPDSAFQELHRRGVQNVIIKQQHRSLLFSDGTRSGAQAIPAAPHVQDVGSMECLTTWAAIALANTGDLAYASYVGAEAMAFSFSRRGALDSTPYLSELQIDALRK
jgi:ribokinase